MSAFIYNIEICRHLYLFIPVQFSILLRRCITKSCYLTIETIKGFISTSRSIVMTQNLLTSLWIPSHNTFFHLFLQVVRDKAIVIKPENGLQFPAIDFLRDTVHKQALSGKLYMQLVYANFLKWDFSNISSKRINIPPLGCLWKNNCSCSYLHVFQQQINKVSIMFQYIGVLRKCPRYRTKWEGFPVNSSWAEQMELQNRYLNKNTK